MHRATASKLSNSYSCSAIQFTYRDICLDEKIPAYKLVCILCIDNLMARHTCTRQLSSSHQQSNYAAGKWQAIMACVPELAI